uniref:Uncharacterized protein n=1 Tax=viral metagenome TaxID=1070528 RepID=A0A6M3KUL1_9ZZZZ
MYTETITDAGRTETYRCEETRCETDAPDRHWVSIGSPGETPQQMYVSSDLTRWQLTVRLPRELNFATTRAAADWLSTAISEHIARCEQEDAELEHRAEHELALEMDKAMEARTDTRILERS